MKPRMAIKRALAVCQDGPKTEAQRSQAIAALRVLQGEIKRDYPHHSADTCAAIAEASDALATADLRGAG